MDAFCEWLDGAAVANPVHLTNWLPDQYTPLRHRRLRRRRRLWPRRLAWSRTPAFHADNTGSNPVGVILSTSLEVDLRRPNLLAAQAPRFRLAFEDHALGTALRRGAGRLVRRTRRPRRRLPFLENVLRGKNVPRERMLEVAEHYRAFRRRQPAQCPEPSNWSPRSRRIARRTGRGLPVYWGNRNWHPLLPDTLAQMADDGVRRALGFFTSAYSSYSGCRQYREDIERARQAVGPAAPQVDKLRVFFNHPGFIGPMVERVRAAIEQIPPDRARRGPSDLHGPQHSAWRWPTAAAMPTSWPKPRASSPTGSVCPTIALAYQSRSGPPQQPWLEPDILRRDSRRCTRPRATRDVVIVPIGFLSDHVEMLYDLDTEARDLCDELGINMVRAATVGSHPAVHRHDSRADRRATRPASHRAGWERSARATMSARPTAACIGAGLGVSHQLDYSRSTIIATAFPPPRHSDASPRFKPRSARA